MCNNIAHCTAEKEEKAVAAKKRTSRGKRKKRKRPVLFFIKLLIIAGALYAVMFYTPVLTVTEVYVTGASAVDPSAVITASEIKPADNLLKIKYGKSCEKIMKIPYVSEAKIKYKFPNKLDIDITEAEIMLDLELEGEYVSIDKNLKILEINENPKTFPIICGISAKKNVPGEKLTIDESDKFDIILVYRKILEDKGLLKKCKKITIDGGDVTIEQEGGIKIICGGRDEAEYKISAFKAALESNPEVTIGTFDVRNPKRVVYKIQ